MRAPRARGKSWAGRGGAGGMRASARRACSAARSVGKGALALG